MAPAGLIFARWEAWPPIAGMRRAPSGRIDPAGKCEARALRRLGFPEAGSKSRSHSPPG